MRQARRIGRLGILAAGVGIGAALAATAGTASADPSTDPFSWIGGLDLGDLSVPAQAATLDVQISIDGMDLFPTAGNTATATSGVGDIAIAIGNGADATASGGIVDSAFAVGNDAGAYAGGGSGSNFDTAIDIGNNTGANDATIASFGNDDTAIDIGNNTGDVEGPGANFGNDDTAIDIGNFTGYGEGSFAGYGNDNLAASVGNGSDANAGGYNESLLSNDNIAYVLDPTGTDGSYADAGANGSTAGGYDLAAVLGGDEQGAFATGAQNLYDIMTALGNESGTAASTSGGFLADLLSLF
jgi:hypothetical protein